MRRNDLRSARKAKGLTQAALAELLGGKIRQGDVSKIENGERGLSIDLAPKLADALGLDLLAVLYPSNDASSQDEAA